MKKIIMIIGLASIATAGWSRELNLCHNFEKGDFPCDDALCKQYKDDTNSVTSCIVGKGGTAPNSSAAIKPATNDAVSL